MKKVIPLVFLLVCACSPVGSSAADIPESISLPSVTPTKTRTVTPMASLRPSPTPTPEPARTSTPSPTRAPTATIQWPDLPLLNPDGPYILWEHDTHGLMLINADGSGMARLNLPYREYYVSGSTKPRWVLDAGLHDEISPDGEWALQYRGDINMGERGEDYTMNLVHLPDGKVPFSIVVMPESVWMDQYNSYQCGMWFSQTHFGVSAWSPDGRYLAFPAHADSGTLDLFVLDTKDLSVHRLTNDPAEIEAFRWSPGGDRIYFTNGNEFEVNSTEFTSYTLNYTLPGNATNQGIHTIATSIDQLLVEGFDWDAGAIYATHENNRCPGAGGESWIKEVYYFGTTSGESLLIASGNILRDSFLVDTVNRAIFFTERAPSESEDPDHTLIVSFEGKILSSMDPESIICNKPILLSGTKYAYICSNTMNDFKTTGVTFGGNVEEFGMDGSISVSPNRKWFLVFGKDTLLFSRDAKLVQTWEGEESFDAFYFFWDPSGKGIYYANASRKIHNYAFGTKATSIIFTCPFADGCRFPGSWIP